MGLGHGVKLLRDGLILHLDAKNIKSYPGTGSTWFDLSGNDNHVTLNNSPTHVNNFMRFNGVDQYGEVSSTVQSQIEAGSGSTVISLSNIKTIEHVDNLIGWGNANNDGGGVSRTWGQYANNSELRTSYNSSVGLGNTSNILNKDLMLVSRYNVDELYANTYGSVNNTDYGDLSGVSSFSWKNILTSYPVTIAKTSYFARYMEVDIAFILVYNKFLTDAEIEIIFESFRGRYGI